MSAPDATPAPASEANHPSYPVMITEALFHIPTFTLGASRPAIKKYLQTTYGVENSPHVNRILKASVASGDFVSVGARFKLNPVLRDQLRKQKQAKAKKKKPAKKKVPKKKAKKSTAKKASTKKKATAKATATTAEGPDAAVGSVEGESKTEEEKKTTSTKKKSTSKKGGAKTGAKKTGTKKTAAKKTGTKKTGVKKTGTKKAGTKKTGAKKTGTKKTGTKKAGTKKTDTKKGSKKATQKTGTKKTGAKKTTKKDTKKATGSKKTSKKTTSEKKSGAKRGKSDTAKKPAAKRAKHNKGKDVVEESVPALKRAASVHVLPQSGLSGAVYRDGGVVYEANLAVVHIESDTDKFHKIQVVRADDGKFHVVQVLGRTGTRGECAMKSFDTAEEAVSAFEAIFLEKAGSPWSERDTYTAEEGNYSLAKKDHNRVQKGVVMWKYYMDNGVDGKANGWYDYAKEASEHVEATYQEFRMNKAWLTVRSIKSGHFSYHVNFSNMSQTNLSTKKTRKIQRFVDNEPNDEA